MTNQSARDTCQHDTDLPSAAAVATSRALHPSSSPRRAVAGSWPVART